MLGEEVIPGVAPCERVMVFDLAPNAKWKSLLGAFFGLAVTPSGAAFPVAS
jgi:hypothetical protein